ncbi:poly-gamma-glutamate capsule biosynthesis protein CapA/YwtB (metallophosphatase superfamily) [Krasilnikovia cinnamomea]|uniref:Poly-gamma-glutamate capsule biosynthesis protein CapA/YwtB (Metallophosphatase superfamily) n=1 Tax=Krasilnikovia cinnamomea TaxID=349313 RepID=A0A4Q7ZII8_9ACTN|nr:CapA family protein [Krasilnikovia cinnamomea]RZU50657.1 poly-gamma-glutamate capsule biosynthesis protein CapA/YwtB (metallophosphatase superfamily) [Krasilnikovia cinnamomea]
MNAHPPPRNGLFGRPILTLTIVVAALIGAGLGGVALADRDSGTGTARWQQPAVAASPSGTKRATPSAEPASGTITLSATGDIIMGSAPNRLPANGGDGFFDSVAEGLKSDLVMGNLEQPLTGDTGASKCGSPPRANCFAFRSPPEYARHLKEAGFQLLNTANNHSKDYGVAGYRNTVAALEDAGLRHTGAEDQITVVDVKGVSVAVVGFSPYAGANNLNDLDHSRTVIEQAKEKADLVVVQVHMGAEGSDKNHVKPGNELFFGENRGDPIAFSHAVIDAGADVVIGHGPHVLRGMEFYKGKLIAYSLGNFAGGGKTLSSAGVLKYSGILHVTLGADGRFAGGTFLSTYLNGVGVPTRDSANERGRKMVAQLSADDFGDTAARIADDGAITPPA